MPPTYYGAAADHLKRPSFHLDRRLLMLVGLGVVAIIFISIAFTVVGGLTGGPKADITTLAARQSSLNKFLSLNSTPVQNDGLKKVTAEAAILTASDYSLLNAQLSSVYNVTAIPDSITAAEADQNADILKSALAAGNYDTTFAGLLHDKLAAEQSLATKIELSSSGTVKIITRQTVANIGVLSAELAALKF